VDAGTIQNPATKVLVGVPNLNHESDHRGRTCARTLSLRILRAI
jgi:hypothetical protein